MYGPSIAGVYITASLGICPCFSCYAPSQKGPDYAKNYAGIIRLLLAGLHIHFVFYGALKKKIK